MTFGIEQAVKATSTFYDGEAKVDVPGGTYGVVTRTSGDSVWMQASVATGWLTTSHMEVRTDKWNLS